MFASPHPHGTIQKGSSFNYKYINNVFKLTKQFRMSAPLSRWNVLTISVLTHPVVSNLALVSLSPVSQK